MSRCVKVLEKTKLLGPLILSTAICTPSVHAQSNDDEIEALRKEVAQLRALVEALARSNFEKNEISHKADETDHAPAEQDAETIAGLSASSSNAKTDETEDRGKDSVEDVLQNVLSDRQPIGRFPDDAFVTSGEFDNSIKIPGTPGSFRIGGFVQVNANFDTDNQGFQQIGTQPTIPVDGSVDDGTDQFSIHTRHSRVNFDYRAPTKLGDFRTFIEFDFFGDGDEFTNDYDLRLRHAAAEIGRLKIGQFWSGFVDVFSFPETADPGGPSVPVLRNPGIYYVHGDRQGSNWGFGIENPAAYLGGETDLIASESIPNIVGFAQLKRDWGYIRIAGLGLQLKSDTDSHFTGGANLSGRITTSFTGSDRNNISFGAQYGSGFVHYFSSYVGELDGIVSDSGEIEATEILGAFFGYQHFWSERWRSTITGSFFDLDLPEGANALDYSYGERVSANLFYTPIGGITFGLEGIYNTIETFDGSDGEGVRIEFLGRFDF